MTEFILVITEFYTSNTDGFARHVSGSTVLWFSPLTYFTHTLISCARAVCTRGRCTKARATSPIWSGTIAYTTNFTAIGTNWKPCEAAEIADYSCVVLKYFTCLIVTFQFQGLPYMNPMSLSDPSLAPLGTAAGTPQQQAQAREMLMNSSMMYLHEVR